MLTLEVLIVDDDNLKNTAFGSVKTCKDIYLSILELYPRAKISICKNKHDLEDVVDRRPDLVFLTNKIMIDDGNVIWLSQYFESNGVNYTGSNRAVLKNDVDKISSKLKIMSCDIATAKFFTSIPGEYRSCEDLPLPFPLFVKPNSSANSDGIDHNSFVVNFVDFEAKVKELYDIYKEPILVEEYLSGKEFTVSIIDSDSLIVAPIEITAPLKGDLRILSKEIKSEDSEVLVAIKDRDIYQKVSNIALSSFKALGAKDFGRIDVKMDAHGKCYFMEANLTPGMTKGCSYFPKSYHLNSMLEYNEMLDLIIRSALNRKPDLKSSNKIINKHIEIVMIEGDIKQKNIAIDIDSNNILQILSKVYAKVSISVIKSKIDLENLVKRNPDLVFSGVKYFNFLSKDNENEEFWLNDYLDDNGISYIGSCRSALENEYDKCTAKNIVHNNNINTADFFTSEPGEYINNKPLPVSFPLFIKPITGGDSRGIDQNSVVNNFDEFESKVSAIYNDQKSRSLIESYLPGSEYSVAVMENHQGGEIIAMPVEINSNSDSKEHSILDFKVKNNDNEDVTFIDDSKIRDLVSALAIAAFKSLNGRSMGRIDIKMSSYGVPYFIEANLMPGLKKGYFYKACLLNQNFSYDQMILTIANNGIYSKMASC